MYYGDIVSLKTPIGEKEVGVLMDFVADENSPERFSIIKDYILGEDLDDILDDLTEREQRILRLRFGYIDGKTRTLQ